MLRFILGTARTGKTALLAELIRQGLSSGERRALVLVPEQFSFETERTFLDRLGPGIMSRVEVVSFTRLCDSIFRTCGGYASNLLDSISRQIAMDTALQECRDALTFYGRQIGYPSFQKTMLTAIDTCKSALVPSSLLMEKAELLPEGSPLRGKLRDLGLILETFNAVVGQSGVDPQDSLGRAAEQLAGQDFFRGYDLYIDAFRDFNIAQEAILSYALAECGTVTVSLCTDRLGEEQPEGESLGLFSLPQRTARRLVRMAKQQGCKVMRPLTSDGEGMTNPDLRRLEQQIFRGKDSFDHKPEGVSVFAAPDLYSECREAAFRIRRAVRTEGVRYRDICVLTRSFPEYRDAMEEALTEYGIPFFCDERMDILASPPVALAESVLRAALRPETSSFLQIAKSGLLGANPDALWRLDDYCTTYELNGSDWFSDFTRNPRGFSGSFTEKDIAELESINELRKIISEPIRIFREETKETDGLTLCRKLYEVLESYQIQNNLSSMIGVLPEEDPNRRLLTESWNTLMGLLERITRILGSRPLSLERFANLLTTLLSQADFGLIPQTLDCVTLAAADRFRTASPSTVFIVGVQDGTFPFRLEDTGLFSQAEQPLLEEAGLPLMEDISSRVCAERFLCYAAITAPTSRITLSYHTGNLKGEACSPSELIPEIKRIFPGLVVEQALPTDSELLAETPSTAFTVLCARRGKAEPDAGLEACLRQDGSYDARIDSLESIGKLPRYHLNRNGSRLFGGRQKISPSQVDTYYKCPFQYFVRYGLRVRPLPKAKVTVLETGNLVHYVLDHTLKKYPGHSLTGLADRDGLRALAAELVESYIREELGGNPAEARIRYQLERLKETCTLLLKHMADEMAQSEFIPVDTELEIGETVPPLRLTSFHGTEITVTGKIDRVDIMEKNGRKYIRILDYKTGQTKFDLKDVQVGLKLQMLIYLHTLDKNGTGRYGKTDSAGILYVPSLFSEQKDEQSKLKMNGLLLDDPEVLKGMERELKGIFIPKPYNQNGTRPTNASLASLEEFGKLGRLIEHKVTAMADRLTEGSIPAYPLARSIRSLCDQCDYRQVCKRENTDPDYQPPEVGKNDDIWTKIDEDLDRASSSGAPEGRPEPDENDLSL